MKTGHAVRSTMLALFVLLSAFGCRPDREETLPVVERGGARDANIVVVTLDTTRADRLGAYGYENADTPTFDRLSREGLRFDNAISPAPLTLPAHASLFTGLEPLSHGVHHNGLYRLDDGEATLAERLQGHGYQTAAFVSAFVLDTRFGLAQGFDVFDDRVAPLPHQAFGGLDSQRTATEVTDAALAWLGSRSEEQPYFLWVHYYDPHVPHRPPDGFPPGYDGELAYVDTELQRLLSLVEDRDEVTIVVVAGDHGESLGEHGESTHSRLIYDSTQRVPLVFWSPGLFPPAVVTDLVGLVDIAPSLLYLVGADSFPATDGVNLFSEPPAPDRSIYVETMATYLEHSWAPLHGLRSRAVKLILAPTPELYDLEADPGETRNVFPSASGPLAAEREELQALLARKLASAPSLKDIASAVSQTPLDAEELERLQSLGYLGFTATPFADRELPDPKEMIHHVERLARADEARRAGRLDEALELAERAYRESPRDLQALHLLGVIYMQAGRTEDAGRAFESYLDIHPSTDVSVLLANVLHELGRPNEGRSLLEQARIDEPDHGGVLITLGDFAADDGHYQEALRLYRLAKEVDPYRASATANQRLTELHSR